MVVPGLCIFSSFLTAPTKPSSDEFQATWRNGSLTGDCCTAASFILDRKQKQTQPFGVYQEPYTVRNVIGIGSEPFELRAMAGGKVSAGRLRALRMTWATAPPC